MAVGPAELSLVHAAQVRGRARAGADRLAPLEGVAEAVLRAELVLEELVAEDEECVDVVDSLVHRELSHRGVLDELARLHRVEEAIEVLALAESEGLLDLIEDDGVRRGRQIEVRPGKA
jgi:hypothetical protein